MENVENKVVAKFEVGKVYRAKSGSGMIRVTRRTNHNVWFYYVREDGGMGPEEEKRKLSLTTYSWHDEGEKMEVLWGSVFSYLPTVYADDEVDYESVVAEYKRIQEAEERVQKAKFLRSVFEFQEWMKREGLTIEVMEKINQKMQNSNYNVNKIIGYLSEQKK